MFQSRLQRDTARCFGSAGPETFPQPKMLIYIRRKHPVSNHASSIPTAAINPRTCTSNGALTHELFSVCVCVCDCEEGGVQGVKGCVGRVVDLNGTAPSVSPPRQGQQGRLSGDAKAARSLHRADQPPVPQQT